MIASSLVAQQLTVFENEYKVPKVEINQLRACIIGYSQTGLWKIIHTITEFVFGLIGWSQWALATQVLKNHPKTFASVQMLGQKTDPERATFQLQRLIDLNKWKIPVLETTFPAPTAAAAPRFSGITIAGHPLNTNGQLDTRPRMIPETAEMVHSRMDAFAADPDAVIKAVAQQWKQATSAEKNQMKQQVIAQMKMEGFTDAQAAAEAETTVAELTLLGEGGQKALQNAFVQKYRSMTAAQKEQHKNQQVEVLMTMGNMSREAAESEYKQGLAELGLVDAGALLRK